MKDSLNEFGFYQEFLKFIMSFKTKKACAEYLGISRVHLYDLINHDRPFSPRIAEKVGFRRELVVRKEVRYLPLLKVKKTKGGTTR